MKFEALSSKNLLDEAKKEKELDGRLNFRLKGRNTLTVNRNKDKENIYRFLEQNLDIDTIKAGKVISASKLLSNPNFFDIAISFLKENPNLLDLIVERRAFNIFGVYREEFENKLKSLYKERRVNNIKEICTKLGVSVDIENLLNSGELYSVNLYKKIKFALDKKKIKYDDAYDDAIVKEIKIKEIICNVADLKRLKAKDSLVETLKSNRLDDKVIDDFLRAISYLNEKGLLVDQNFRSDYVKSYFERIDLSSNLIGEINKYVEAIVSSSNVEKFLEKYDTSSEKEVVVKKTYENTANTSDFNLSGGFEEFQYYKNIVIRHKGLITFIVDGALKKLGINESQRNKMFSRLKLDWRNINSREGMEKVLNTINTLKESIWLRIIKDKLTTLYEELEKRFSNYLEEEALIKSGKLFNTEYIWLYSNNASDLKLYNPIMPEGNLPEEYKNLEWRNNVCKRADFVKYVLSNKILSINSKGLSDYFLKTKIKYGTWQKALGVIYAELGKDKFVELTDYIKKNVASDYIKENGAQFEVLPKILGERNLSALIENIKDFREFSEKNKVEDDLNILKKDLMNEEGILGKRVYDIYKKVKTEGIRGENEQKTLNIANYAIKNENKLLELKGKTKLSSESVGNILLGFSKSLILKYIKEGDKNWINNLDPEQRKKIEPLYNLSLKICSVIGKDGLDHILVKDPEALKYFIDNIFSNPNKAAQKIVLSCINSGLIKADQFVEKVNSLLDTLGIKTVEEVKKDLKELLKGLYESNLSNQDRLKLLDSFREKINKKNDYIYKLFLKKLLTLKGTTELGKIYAYLFENKDFEKIDLGKLKKEVIEYIDSTLSKYLGLINISKEINEKTEEEVKQYLIEKQKNPENSKQSSKSDDGGLPANKHQNKKKPSVEEISKIISEIQENTLSKNEEGKKLLAERNNLKLSLLESGFYNFYEKESIFLQIRKISDNVDNESNVSLTKATIKYENEFKNKHKFKTENGYNFDLSYKVSGGVVEVQTSFVDGISEIVKALSIKEANKKLLLNFIQYLGFYKADEISFLKDTNEIYKQFGIDINKKLEPSDIEVFGKNLFTGILFMLKNSNKLSGLQKEYVNSFEKKYFLKYDINTLLKELMEFLNNNEYLAYNIGLYDFTERKIKLENIPSTDNDLYRKFLKEIN